MPAVLLLALFVLETHAFISLSSTRHAFASSHLAMTATHQDWELPDEVPSEPSCFSSDLSQLKMSETRRRRLQHEAAIRNKFVSGDELILLRQHALSLREELQQARLLQATRRTHELEQQILKIQRADAEFVYTMNLERMYMAEAEGRDEDYQEYHKLAMEARSALPQYNLDGLWVGKYGDDCYEMINVTYIGDTLIAYKVTGHSTVPSGEISFQANLSPFNLQQQEELEPIELGDDAAQQWECKYLPRFSGTGQVASSGFTNRQFVQGQLIMVKDYFSFAWIPLGHQVFFGRPSAELALKMMQEATPQSRERAHLQRCMEETILLQEEAQEEHEEYFYSTNQADYYNQKGCFE